MDEAIERAAAYLPEPFAKAVMRMSEADGRTVREIRLRQGTPLTLSTDDGERFLLRDGRLSRIETANALPCGTEELEECVKRLCDYSLHTRTEELRRGFLSAGGCRAGLGGTVVTDEHGRPLTVRDVRSICLRVAREHFGCAAPLTEAIERCASGGLLLYGAPGSGKTSLLRDVACSLSRGRYGKRRRVAVVDERSELALGKALFDCDVLLDCPKAEGILRAVRCFSPEFLVFDEWTSEEETRAVQFAAGSGVRVITAVHAGDVGQLLLRRELRRLWENGGFSVLAEVSRDHRVIIREERHEVDRIGTCGDSGDGVGT